MIEVQIIPVKVDQRLTGIIRTYFIINRITIISFHAKKMTRNPLIKEWKKPKLFCLFSEKLFD